MTNHHPQEFLSQEQIAEYQGVFELFDKEKRGTIDFEALKAGMLAMSTTITVLFPKSNPPFDR